MNTSRINKGESGRERRRGKEGKWKEHEVNEKRGEKGREGGKKKWRKKWRKKWGKEQGSHVFVCRTHSAMMRTCCV